MCISLYLQEPYCKDQSCTQKGCPNGYLYAVNNGCRTCECDPCTPMMCGMHCEHGFKKNELGCDICECEPCSKRSCRMYCEHGFKTDENGCEICECEPCAPVMCGMYCEHGFKKNEQGCDICECEACPPVMCGMYCEHGFKKNEHGCDICECEGKCISHIMFIHSLSSVFYIHTSDLLKACNWLKVHIHLCSG